MELLPCRIFFIVNVNDDSAGCRANEKFQQNERMRNDETAGRDLTRGTTRAAGTFGRGDDDGPIHEEGTPKLTGKFYFPSIISFQCY